MITKALSLMVIVFLVVAMLADDSLPWVVGAFVACMQVSMRVPSRTEEKT